MSSVGHRTVVGALEVDSTRFAPDDESVQLEWVVFESMGRQRGFSELSSAAVDVLVEVV